MKRLTVLYFAVLREQRGLASESLTTQAGTAADLYGELRTRHSFTLPAESLRAALNGDFAPWTAELRDGDDVAFLPPVSGG
jgi:molybdopterin converting factor subunit 1